MRAGWYVCTIELGRELGREPERLRWWAEGDDSAGLSSCAVEAAFSGEGVTRPEAAAVAAVSTPNGLVGLEVVGEEGVLFGLLCGRLHWDMNERTVDRISG